MTGGPLRAPGRKLFVRTWGCQMNVYDSARMADVLAAIGYVTTDRPDDADMIVLNTCHIRERASEKLFSELGRLRPVKEARLAAGGDLVLAVAGCVAQAEGGEILDRAPWVDIVLGPQTYHRLPELVARAARAGSTGDGRGVLDTDFPVEPKFDRLPAHGQPAGPAAFLTIQEGCDRFCTFCVVPYTRGAEFSRPAAAIIAEAGELVSLGARDITLLGQNVNAWHGAAPDSGEWRLGRLIRALAGLPGLERIRYTTSHPRDMDDDLIAVHGEVPQCMPWLHLPVQSGADRMLRAMHRGHAAADYLRLVDRLRDACPDIAMSSDFIVGFPGETDADFDATMGLIDRVGFASAYSFIYSPRPGTPAAAMERQIPPADARARLAALQALVGKQQRDFNEATVGRTVPVLFERPGRHPGQIVGRSPWMQAVHVAAAGSTIGQLVDIRIDGCTTHGLSGAPAMAPEFAAATGSDREARV